MNCLLFKSFKVYFERFSFRKVYKLRNIFGESVSMGLWVRFRFFIDFVSWNVFFLMLIIILLDRFKLCIVNLLNKVLVI